MVFRVRSCCLRALHSRRTRPVPPQGSARADVAPVGRGDPPSSGRLRPHGVHALPDRRRLPRPRPFRARGRRRARSLACRRPPRCQGRAGAAGRRSSAPRTGGGRPGRDRPLMAAGVDAIRPPMAVADGVSAWVAQEAAVLASLAVVAGLVLATLPYQVAQDGWLSLVAGRDIVAHGLPHVDTLTALGGGRAWIDQQWLAHLVLYGTYRAGGMGLVLALHAAVLILTFSLAALAARRLGGAPAQVALMLMAAAAAAPWAWQLRAQTFALPFAVVLVWLLAEDARRPSPRVLLAVPLLVLWANVHGSVLLAAGIVGLAGLLAARHRRPEAVVLLAAPAAV